MTLDHAGSRISDVPTDGGPLAIESCNERLARGRSSVQRALSLIPAAPVAAESELHRALRILDGSA